MRVERVASVYSEEDVQVESPPGALLDYSREKGSIAKHLHLAPWECEGRKLVRLHMLTQGTLSPTYCVRLG
jgi:hypothetical protein